LINYKGVHYGHVANVTVANSYLGIHLGFYLGGGKWGRKAQ